MAFVVCLRVERCGDGVVFGDAACVLRGGVWRVRCKDGWVREVCWVLSVGWTTRVVQGNGVNGYAQEVLLLGM